MREEKTEAHATKNDCHGLVGQGSASENMLPEAKGNERTKQV